MQFRAPGALILLFLVSATLFADPALYQDNKKGVLYLGAKAPVIDGHDDDWAGLLGTSPRLFVYGKPVKDGDPSAVFVYRSDNKYLYILAEVTDSTANPNELPAPLAWRGDSVEVYIGTETAPHEHYARTDNQIRLVPASQDGPKTMTASVNDRIVDTERDVKGATAWTDKGYTIEAAIPLRLLQIKGFTVGQPLRMEFQINDARTGEREALVHWSSKADNTYFYPNSWGDGVVEALPGEAQ